MLGRLFFFILIMSAAAWSDQIELKSGRKVVGTIERETSQTVFLRKPNGKLFKYKKSTIVQIHREPRQLEPDLGPRELPDSVAKQVPRKEKEEPFIRLGMMGGLYLGSAHYVASGALVNTSVRNGFGGGLWGDIRVSDFFFLEGGAFMAQIGFREPFGATDRPVSFTVLHAPMLVKGRFRMSPSFLPFIVLGFSIEALLRADRGTQGVAVDILAENERKSISLVSGAGAEYRLFENVWVSLQLRYVHGFTNLSKTGDELKLRTLQILGAVVFGV